MFPAGETTWNFVDVKYHKDSPWCSFQSGNVFEAVFMGQSVIKPIRGDKILFRMRSGKVGIFQIYWFLPLFTDNRWKAKACFVGYKDESKNLPIRLGPSTIALVEATLGSPSLEKLAEAMSRSVNQGTRGPLPPSRQLPSVSCEPVARSNGEGTV
jgi:hypothetical protein